MRTFWEVGVFSNPWLIGVVFLTGFLQISLHYIPLTQEVFKITPLSLNDILLTLPFALVSITVIEMRKIIKRSIKGDMNWPT